MRGLGSAVLTISFCLGGAASAGAQSQAPSRRPPAPRPPLVSPRADLLRPIGPIALEGWWLRPDSLTLAGGLASARPAQDSVRPHRLCPMPVARPDTTSLERMPVDRRDSVRVTPMPTASGCANPLFR